MTASELPVRTTVITGESTITTDDLGQRMGLKRYGRSWRGDCPSCGYQGAFSASDGKRGTLLWCANGCDQKALSEAVSRISGGTWEPPSGRTDPDQSKRKAAAALRLWNGARPVAGTAAERYLRGRGLAHLIGSAGLRFEPACPHPEKGWRLPALLALVTGADDQPVGIHRTFIDSWGSKAKVEPPKASLGPIWGGAVRLNPIGPELVIGEGLESAASAGRLLNLSAWAAISAGNLAAGLILPAAVRTIIISADNDAPLPDGKRPGQDAARAAWFRWRGEGREVRIAIPDKKGSDFNDLLLARLAREAAQ